MHKPFRIQYTLGKWTILKLVNDGRSVNYTEMCECGTEEDAKKIFLALNASNTKP